MSHNYPEHTLCSARQVIRNGIAEVLHLTHGDLPEAWDMARTYAEEILEACKVAHIELADYTTRRNLTPLITGNDAIRAIASIDIASPELDAALDEFEDMARQTAAIRAENEAKKIDAAHPGVFDMASFAAQSLGLKKEA